MNTDPMIGRQLGDYILVAVLGYGGMARVYRGYDEKLDRFAAIKIIDSQLIAHENAAEYYERFQREARAIARLRHPNIVDIYQFGEVAGSYYMAMRFIEGHDLRHILDEYARSGSRLSHAQALRITRDIAAALDHSHRAGVIHRDVKPSNIVVTQDGQSILTDFGLALNITEGTAGNIFGSVRYIAPEQAISAANALPQSDLYSLGIVVYEILTGQVPFNGHTLANIALKQINEAPPAPSAINPEISPEAEQALLTALDKDPAKRYASGQAMVAALEAALGMMDHAYGQAPVLLPVAESPHVRAAAATTLPESTPIVTGELPAADLATWHARYGSIGTSMPRRAKAGIATGIFVALLLVAVGTIVLGVNLPGDDGHEPVAMAATLTMTTTAADTLAPTPTATAADLAATEIPAVLIAGTTARAATFTVTRNPTRTPTATATASRTPRPVSSASNTANPSPTATRTPHPSPSLTATPTPAATARPATTPVPPTTARAGRPAAAEPTVRVVLLYDRETLVMSNRSAQSVDVSGLRFVQLDRNGETRSFRADSWALDGFSPADLPSRACLQVWTISVGSLPVPSYCEQRLAWRQVPPSRWFWASPESDAVFEVRRGDEVLATCRIADGVCSLDLRVAQAPPAGTTPPPPTPAPSPTFNPVTDAPVILFYDDDTLVLFNRSRERVAVSEIFFVQIGEPGAGRVFYAEDWSDGALPPEELAPQGCLQVWKIAFAFLNVPEYCGQRQAWRQLAPARWFWVSDQPDAAFEVRRGSAVLATCRIADGVCPVDVRRGP